MYIDQGPDDLFKTFASSQKGLSEGEAQSRLEKYGRNAIVSKKKISPIILFLNQFRSFIIYILIGATAVSALIGEYIDSIVILVILLFNAVLGFIQEYKAEKSIEALKKMASLKAKAIRDNREVEVDATELVPGDIIMLETGDKVPADARLLEIKNLECNESSLTGESVPVKKEISLLNDGAPIADQKNMVFSGTVVTGGRGRAIVVQTGMKTQIGNIAKMIEGVEQEQTPLQERLDKLGRFLGYAVIGICIVVFLLGMLRNEEIVSLLLNVHSIDGLAAFLVSLKEVFMTSVALAVAAIPEGLAAVVTVALALGVQRMVKRHALIRKLPAVETLGCTTVICTDKTGTLTRNEMTVRKLYFKGNVVDVTGAGYGYDGEFFIDGNKADPKDFAPLLKIGALNNDASVDGSSVIGDPTEGSLIVSAAKSGLDKKGLEKLYPRIDEIAFDSERKRMSTLHKAKDKNLVYVKGAPDIVLDLCTRIYSEGKVRKISLKDKEKILEANKRFSSDALRVLAFAYKEEPKAKITEDNLIFAGLQAMIDPPRMSAKEAVKKCRDAGIKVVMITGDHIVTAQAVGREIGITGKAITGQELEAIDNLDGVVEDISIYARVNPEHKMRIVEALKKKDHIVAMTGDGVNDAPALKNADIGVAMGITGTDVSKEASDMILTDDNFASIVDAVEEGRGIDDNIKKFVNYLLSSNMGEVLVIFVAMLIGFHYAGAIVIPLLAVQLLWMNLVTDGLPALALGVDPIDKNIMKRPPRKSTDKIISKNMLLNITVIGIMLCAFTLYIFNIGLSQEVEDPVAKARTMAFTSLVIFEIVRVYMIRSQYNAGVFSNKYLLAAIMSSILLQLMVVYLDFFNAIFETTPLALADWGYILGGAALMLLLGSILSPIIRRVTHEMD